MRKTRSADRRDAPVRRTAVVAVGAALTASLTVAMEAPGTALPQKRADLVVAKVGTPPVKVRQGGSFGLGAIVANSGKAAAAKSTLRFYLTKDRTRGTDDLLGGTVAVKKVPAGKRKTVSGTIKVPSSAQGKYWVIACADSAKRIKETKERNNCRISKTQVEVDADLHAKLAGKLTFLDSGTRTDPSTGETETWNHTGSATININIDGDPHKPTFASTGSTYERAGTVTTHAEDPSCVVHSDRTENGGGTLKYAGQPFTDEIGGAFGKTDLSEVHVMVQMRASWTQTDTRAGRGDFPCEASSTTTQGTGLILTSIDLRETSATADAIRYRVTSFVGDMNTVSDWDKVEGELVLTLR